MSDRRIAVFFYGLFMDVRILNSKGLDPKNVVPASVPGFALRNGERATLVADSGSKAYGLLMYLTHDEVRKLYSEESVRAYQPEAVMAVLADNSPVPALCFNLVTPPTPAEKNPGYAAKLRELAGRLRLPSDYVASIE
jgi:hypothetical protein